MSINVRRAREGDLNDVRALYRSVIGRPGCTWNEYYPGEEEITADFSAGTLYLITEDGTTVGTVSVVPENELDGLDCWKQKDRAGEIARVAVSPARQGRGIAAEALKILFDSVMKPAGLTAVHLLVAVGNPAAINTYRKLGFAFYGTVSMYGNEYYTGELIL